MDAAQALQRLKDGNRRFVEGRGRAHDHHGRRTSTRGGQAPFAVVLTCSDSRVAPELLFDSGIGDLFVIRVAGNVAGTHERGSIAYAVEQLGTPLVVVLGHESCGAVTAAFEGADLGGDLGALLAAIDCGDADSVDAAIRTHVSRTVERIQGAADVVGALYHFATGDVEFL